MLHGMAIEIKQSLKEKFNQLKVELFQVIKDDIQMELKKLTI